MKYSCRARRLEMATRSRDFPSALPAPLDDFGIGSNVPPADRLPGVTGTSILGNPVRRVEDPRILLGGARYVGDLDLPGVLTATFVRSTVAHARLESVVTTAAAKMPGVVAVYTAGDL